MFQRALASEVQDAIPIVEPEHCSKPPFAAETLPVPMRSDMSHDERNTVLYKYIDQEPNFATRSGVRDSHISAFKQGETQRLQDMITQENKTDRTRETQLRVAREGLKNAREALDETSAEYTKVCKELKTVKQGLSKDHQAIVYRKDIELFALRKMNEQREKNLTQRDAQLEEMQRQHAATLEVKEEQMRLLKDRLAVLELSDTSPRDQDDGDHALEVRLLKVTNARKSLEVEQDKDAIIFQLQEDLAVAKRSAEAVVNQQAELKRAWHMTKNIQAALQDERDITSQLREQLRAEKGGEVSEKSSHEQGPANSTGRLPTIEEDENDKSELEAMLDAAQMNNSELNSKLAVLEKRLRDANARLFSTVQEAEALRSQVRFEQARKHDQDDSNPSTMHRVQLDRLQAELDEARDLIAAKDEEIGRHEKSMSDVDRYVGRLRREIDAAIRFHTEDQDEISSLQKRISELEHATVHHTYHCRPHVNSAEHVSTESSGTTLVQQSSPQPIGSLVAPEAPYTSRPRAHSASAPNRPSILSNEVVNNDPELNSHQLRTAKRTSLSLRDMMKKMLYKEDNDLPSELGADPVRETKVKQFDRSRMKNALASMTPNAMPRPATATASVPTTPMIPVMRKPTPATAPVPENMRPSGFNRTSMRYYATTATKEDDRPQTAASKNVKTERRRSWGAQVQTKLKRRSLY